MTDRFRCKLSPLGLERIGRGKKDWAMRRGWARLGSINALVVWDGNKVPTEYHPSFIEPSPPAEGKTADAVSSNPAPQGS